MAVNFDDVTKIAGLARLHVDESQLPTLVEQLNSILGHMEVLQQVDTSELSTTAESERSMPLRDDVVNPAPMRLSAQGLTAETRDGFILVPRLSTHEEL